MPDVFRIPVRADCNGLDLTHPLDRMPPGYFSYLFNARVLVEGRIDGRPGYTGPANSSYPDYITLQTPTNIPNSVRRLNDPSEQYAPTGYIYVGGGGSELYAGVEDAYIGVDTGYSGNPLSLIPFRPNNSPESWMYVYDANKLSKVRPDGAVRAIGVAPPTIAPAIEYGVPATVDVDSGQESAGGWVATGSTSAVTTGSRSTGYTIGNILYNSGTTGWCCISPTASPIDTSWMGLRMKVTLSGGPENVVVREIWPAIPNTTIQSIQYDVANIGLCSIVLNLPIGAIPGGPSGLARNSLINIVGDIMRVLEVILSPDGTSYSLRCNAAGTHAAGDSVIGLLSWYCYTTSHHSAGETIATSFIDWAPVNAGATGGATLTANINAGTANGRPIDTANDYLHISVFLTNPQAVTSLQFLVSLDATANLSFTEPGNSIIWTIQAAQLSQSGYNTWTDIVIPISQGVRTGFDLTRTLANISGIAIQATSPMGSSGTDCGFDWWYFFGTYGQVVQPNSPVGTVYLASFRDSTTGAHSVPSPQDRYQLFPLRESVIITPQTSTQVGVDSIDLYRQGGNIPSPLYVATIPNNTGSPASYTDGLPDISVQETNQPPDLNAIQPWPLLQPPISGTCNVVGTSVVWVSGGLFEAALLNDTEITINGTAYLTYGQPSSTTTLQIQKDGGSLSGVPFLISSPTLAGQPLPYAFGALEGPFAPVVFALGDPINGGTLYFSNFNDADSASDANTLELAPPTSNLVSGAVWNGMAFCASRDTLFNLRFSYLTTIGASNNTSFQWYKVPSPSGMWSRWTCCAGPDGVYFLGRDGIYKATEQGAVNISDAQLYPLFPHDGQPGAGVSVGGVPILPVDMTYK